MGRQTTTVRELIADLQECDLDLPVVCRGPDDDAPWEIRSIWGQLYPDIGACVEIGPWVAQASGQEAKADE